MTPNGWSRLLVLLLCSTLLSCSYPCELARQELAYVPPAPDLLPDDRYALGLSLSRDFINRVLHTVLDRGDGFRQELPLSVALPSPLNRLPGKLEVELVELEMIDAGDCPSCSRMRVDTQVEAKIVGIKLPPITARAIGDLRLSATADGSTIILWAGIAGVQEVEVLIDDQDSSQLLRRAIVSSAEKLGGPVAAAAAKMLLSARALRKIQEDLDVAIRQAAAQGLEVAAKAAFAEDLELTRFQAPPFGSVSLVADRVELRTHQKGLFLGIDPMGWPVEQTVGALWHDDDLTLVAAGSSLTRVIDIAMEGGVLPRAIDIDGQTGPDAKYKLQSRSVEPGPDGFDLMVRLWRTDTQCGWVDLSARLSTEISGDELAFNLSDFKPKKAKGGGRSLASGLRLYNAFSRDNLEIAQKLGASSQVKILDHSARWSITDLRGVENRAELSMSLVWDDEKNEKPKPKAR